MGRLLSRLLSNAESGEPATPATLGSPEALTVAKSQVSQGCHVENVDLYAHLLALAEVEGLDAAIVHRLDAEGVEGIADGPDADIRKRLHTLAAHADMDAGRVPHDWTEVAHCARCGPIWWHTAEHRPSCPWCFRRMAGKAIPQPKVRCGDCQHYLPDPLNPQAGTGDCAADGDVRWPMQRHACAAMRPK